MILREFKIDLQDVAPWPTAEPFLFCVHHFDHYPKGESNFGPDRALLKGRNLGQDFAGKNNFRMYHGEIVPGFPVHPHRGFETITIVRKGYVDHADSMGATGRYGEGDVQWMTAGSGVQHSEMFPLLCQDSENTLELFQIWLNLPKKSKMVPAHFKMFWAERIPRLKQDDGRVDVQVIAGEFESHKALAPPPDSWAARPENHVSILLIDIESGGTFALPATSAAAQRRLYFYEGTNVEVSDVSLKDAGKVIAAGTAFDVDGRKNLFLKVLAKESRARFLLLQSKPIGEPVVQHGPFVMTSRQEILQTIADYQETEFGGWHWEESDPVHGGEIRRFARLADGTIDTPSKS